jgi:predicted aspartyl protease
VDVGAGVGDNSALSRAVGRRVDGILGSRFFAWMKLSVTIDYPGQTLDLVEVEDGAGPCAAGAPLQLANQYPLVPVELNRTGPFLFLVDTGASGCIVSPQAAGTLQLPRGAEVTARGLASVIASYRSVLPRLSVGEARVEDLEVTVMECAAISENSGTRVDGYLGHDFLSRFAVTLDYPGQRLVLR